MGHLNKSACRGMVSECRGIVRAFAGWCAACVLFLLAVGIAVCPGLRAQIRPGSQRQNLPPSRGQTTQDYNQRLNHLLQRAAAPNLYSSPSDYRIGPEDLLQISVFEASDLNRTVRVSADGEISLPLLGSVQAAGLTSRELEVVLEELLRRTYMKDPHVSVFVTEMQSHPVSVFGAVEKPGVFQIRGAKTLIEVLSMAQGLAGDAGDTVIVMRHGGLPTPAGALPGTKLAVPTDRRGASTKQGVSHGAGAEASATKSIKVNLKDLLDSGDPRYNVLIYPGDVVKVTRAGIVYVVGEVRKPGGFLLKTNENISVLQALALAEGLTSTSAAKHARIIRTDKTSGERTEIPINLKKILADKAPDPLLRSKDILFVPNSAGKAAFYRGAEAAIGIASGLIVYRR
jgi:polysaccharide biosynthesis/export protein